MQAPPPRILLLEDEPDPALLLTQYLTHHGLVVDAFANGLHAWQALATAPPAHYAGAVLDVMVPGLDGLALLGRIRTTPALAGLPVLLLTARDQEADELEALAHGADDYIPKPASLARVLARVQALLRRQTAPPPPATVTTGSAGADESAPALFQLLPQALSCRVMGQRVALTATEYHLLALLATHPGRVFTRQEILEALAEPHHAVFDRTVDAHIKNLRHKLGPAAALLRTARGTGYMWEDR